LRLLVALILFYLVVFIYIQTQKAIDINDFVYKAGVVAS